MADLSKKFNDQNADAQPDIMSKGEYRTAFVKMAADYFTNKIATENPELLYVTGLPGAGKSTKAAALKAEMSALENYVHVNFDDLRVYHPRYAEHVKQDPLNAAAHIDKAVEQLIGWLCEEAAKRKLNVILDDAAMGADMTRIVLGPFRDNGYAIKASVVAVPALIARQSVHLRFEENFAAALAGKPVIPRWVNSDEQNNAPAALVETVETIEDEKICDSLVVTDRQGKNLSGGSAAVKNELHRDLTLAEKETFQQNATRIAALMQARNSKPQEISMDFRFSIDRKP